MKNSGAVEKKAIVLSGGGARGAYQVGVLKALSEIAQKENKKVGIQIYTGLSAGAINAGFMAAYADDFHVGVEALVCLWSQLESQQVFSSDAFRMAKIALQWMEELPFGAIIGTTPGRALLDTAPLHKLINDHLPFERIQKNIDSGCLHALAVTATDYGNSESVTFVQGHPSIKDWSKVKKVSRKARINTSHIMASSAIPLLFPPIEVNQRFFGDGCLRNTSPCAPSVYLGADNVLVIGVRRSGPDSVQHVERDTHMPSFARMFNVVLNAVLLDGIESDVARMERVNRFVTKLPDEFHNNLDYRALPYCFISPSADIGEMALHKAHRLPRVIRYLMKGLGRLEDASETLSYLLFDSEFCRDLIEIGYQDGLNQREKLQDFLA